MGIFDTEATTKVKMNDRQKKLVDASMPFALDWLNSDFKLGPQIFVGKNPLMQQGQRMLTGAAGGVSGLAGGGMDAIRSFLQSGGRTGAQGAATLAGAANPASRGLGAVLGDYASTSGSRDFLTSGALLNPNTNPVLKKMTAAAVDPIRENLTEKVLPGIRSDFVGGNMFGSSRQGIAERGAIKDFTKLAADATTAIQNNAFNEGLGAMLSATNKASDVASQGIGQGFQAGAAGAGVGADMALQSLGLSPEIGRLAFMPGMTMDALGERDRQMAMAKNTEASERFNTQQMMPWMKAQDIMQLAFGIPGGSSSASSGGSGVTQAIGGAATLAGLWPMISNVLPLIGLSDRSMKEDIEFVGEVAGYKWYGFSYKDAPEVRRLGVMADEVEAINPSAVFRDAEGIAYVNYAAL